MDLDKDLKKYAKDFKELYKDTEKYLQRFKDIKTHLRRAAMQSKVRINSRFNDDQNTYMANRMDAWKGDSEEFDVIHFQGSGSGDEKTYSFETKEEAIRKANSLPISYGQVIEVYDPEGNLIHKEEK